MTDTGMSGLRAGMARAAARGLLFMTLSSVPAVAPATPHDLVLMLDNSGSMRRNDPDALTRVAVRAFLDRLVGDYRVAIVAFDQQVNLLMPLTRLDDSSRGRFLDSLDAIDYAGQLTNSPAALERALYELRQSGRPDAERFIIFMTDGIVDVAPEGADPGDVEKARWMKTTLADEAADNRVRIFGIAFTDNADFELIQTLAKRTGGEYYRAYSAADIDSVFAGIRERILAGRPPGPTGADRRAGDETAPAGPGATAGRRGADVAARANPASNGLPRAVLPPSALPQAEPRRADPPGTEPPGVNLPGAGLPAVALPAVKLPVVPQPGVPAPAGEGGSTASAANPAGSPAAPGPAGIAPGSPAATPPASGALRTSPPPAPRPAQSGSTVALVVGGIALLLALAALLVLTLRRRAPAVAPAAGTRAPRAFLNDVNGVTGQPSYALASRPVMVGRLRGPEPESTDYIVIDESTVGRQHALIEYREHAFWITDQNSLNGTFVNDARIETPTRLKHGDRIRFHRQEFEFVVLGMFETDRTMMSDSVFADPAKSAAADDDEDATVVREDERTSNPSPQDPTIPQR